MNSNSQEIIDNLFLSTNTEISDLITERDTIIKRLGDINSRLEQLNRKKDLITTTINSLEAQNVVKVLSTLF